MKKIFLSFILFLLFIPIKLNAVSKIIMDMDSNRVLYSENINKKSLIASTTKIMTCLIALENGNLKNKYIVGNEINEVYGSSMYLSIGEELSLKELLYGLMLRSGNDASVVISNNVVKDEKEFIYLMNKKAKDLNMKNTSFFNPHGLDNKNENISTAYDLAILTKYAMKNKDFRKITNTKRIRFKTNVNKYELINKNNLLYRYKYCNGGKTGYTDKAGYTFVSTAKRGNTNLIIVTFGIKNRFNTHKSLYEEYFNKYKTYLVFSKRRKIKSKYYKNNLYIKNNILIALSLEEKNNISIKVKLNKKKDKNNKVGILYVYLYDKVIYKENVYLNKKHFRFL